MTKAVSPSRNELIERLEKATGRDRELDARIQNDLVSWRTDRASSIPYTSSDEDLPHYTSSLDAAVSLIPDGCEYSISTLYHIAQVEVGLNFGDGWQPGESRRVDNNVPLAICIAALKARGADHE